MTDSFHLSIQGKTYGPYSRELIEAMYTRGEIDRSAQVWKEGDEAWQHLEHFLNLPPATASAPIPKIVREKPRSKRDVIYCCIAIGFAFFMVIGTCSQALHNASSPPAAPTEADAFLVSQKFVKQLLKSPSSARFSEEDDPESYASQRHDLLYECGGFVDSQNSFGAMIRAKWKTIVKPEGNEWKALYVRVGSEEVGQFTPDSN